MLRPGLINNWAKALREIAVEQKKVESYIETLEGIKIIFEDNEEATIFLADRFIPLEKRIALIDKVFKKEIDIYILNFLKLIIEREIFLFINYILKASIKKLWGSLKIKKGTVFSTIAIDKKTILQMEEKISKKINQKVKLENKIDGHLIAGVRIEVANNVFDYSLKGKTEDMKQMILENRK